MENEDNYKRESSSRTQKLLSDWINSGFSSRSLADLNKMMETILSGWLPSSKIKPNLTDWRENQYIFENVLGTPQDQRDFYSLLFAILSPGLSSKVDEKSLAKLFEWLDSKSVRPGVTKSLPTLLLFYWNPSEYIYIKPTPFDNFLELTGHISLGRNRLSLNDYLEALKKVTDFRKHISDLKPRDMIDVQTFYYVVTWYPKYGGPPPHDLTSLDQDLEAAKKTYQSLSETEKQAIIQSRRGQGQFREKLVRKWRGCSVTGFSPLKELLTASHIKPWRVSNNKERLDPDNGLLLLPNLDKLFDSGYISFSNSGQILISPRLNNSAFNLLGINKSMKLSKAPSQHQAEYLEFHSRVIFRNS